MSDAGWRWAARMAWRDSRGQRRKLSLFVLSIVAGIAALVAINSFRDNLDGAIDAQARELLGADLRLSASRPFSERMESFIAETGDAQARETRFRSMAFFPEQEQARLVQVRALSGGFPFYGDYETTPAGVRVQEIDEPVALIDAGLMRQYQLEVGDPVSLGTQTFRIAGQLDAIAGEAEVGGVFAPRVIISRAFLEGTGLVEYGSVAFHIAFFRFEGGLPEAWGERLKELEAGLFAEERIRVQTVESRQEQLARVLGNLYRFLGLVGFVALLLGGIGVAGAVQVYLQEKLGTVAVLRCLGARAGEAFRLYLLQILVAGFTGAVLGVVLGVAVQFLLPVVMGPFLPVEVPIFLSWPSIGLSLLYGWAVAVLFAFVPLLGVRRVSPLSALRAGVEPLHRRRKDPWFWVVVTLLLALGLGFCLLQTRDVVLGLGFAGGLAASLAVLWLVASATLWTLRRLNPNRGSYAARLGLTNLYRPNNRTRFLIVTLGMGAFLINTLFLTRNLLLEQVEVSFAQGDPNLVLVDVQPDQLAGVEELLTTEGYPVADVVPVVTMRPLAIKGRAVEEIRNDPDRVADRWTLTWEFRVTYRDALLPNEEIIAGAWTGHHPPESTDPVPISLAENLLEDFGVGVGDTITWDVQGVPIETVIGSVRAVDWEFSRLNFGIVWPTGLLEEAPAFIAVLTRAPDRAATAGLQQKLVQRFPNVSAVDLSLLFESLTSILTRVAFVLQFMAAFTIATGLIVLAGSVIMSRYQRVRESVLLRTLGASGAFIRRVMSVEYALLGVLAAAVGIALSVAGAWALAHFAFDLPFSVGPLATVGSLAAMAILTLLTGLINSRGIASHPPLVILRDEG